MIEELLTLALLLVQSPAVVMQDSDDLVPASHVTDIAVSEEFAGKVQDDLSATFLRALSTQDWARLESAFLEDAQGTFPSPKTARIVAEEGPLIQAWGKEEVGEEHDRGGLVAVLREHVGNWVAVDRATCKLFRFLLHPDRIYAFGAAHLVLAGRLPGGARTELHAEIALGLVRPAVDQRHVPVKRQRFGHLGQPEGSLCSRGQGQQLERIAG